MKRYAGGAIGVLLVGGLTFVGVQYQQQAGVVLSQPGTSCDVNISSPVRDRANSVVLRSSDSLDVTVSGTAARCPSTTVTVTRSENGAAETAVGTPSTNGSGVWSQALTITDAVNTTVFARMTAGGKTTEARILFVPNTALPKLVVTAPAADDFGVLNVVAPSEWVCAGSGGNWHATAGEKGWLCDSSCADGGQVATSFTVTGAAGGTYDVSYAGASLASGAVSSSPETFTPTLTLADLTRGDLVFSATNGSGTTAKTLLTRVLVAAPPRPTGPDGGALVYRLTSERAATVEMDFALPSIPVDVPSASVSLLWTTGLVITPDGGGWALMLDGGRAQLDGGVLDLGVLVHGRNVQGRDPANGGDSHGLVMRLPNECILYDPSESPQVWECKGGERLASGSTRTSVFRGLPPNNTYYLWPAVIY